MSDDIEQRLAEAAAALRERELTEQRCEDLRVRIEQMRAELAELRSRYAAEQRDVDKLEGLTLSRVLASLRGARDDLLARERAEAEAARYRLAEAEARLDALRTERAVAQARLRRLAAAPITYDEVLNEKARYLASSGDPRGARLLELADERGRLIGELHEVTEAQRAADTARGALARVRNLLDNAADWAAYDMYAGGTMSSMVKHSRLDEAAEAAAYADRCLALLRTELADVPGLTLTAPQVAIGGMTKFADIWFDNIFTDFVVANRIDEARWNVDRAIRLVDVLVGRLAQRSAQTRADLERIEAERNMLLADG